MQGAPRQQVNVEELLAELKRVLESSAHPPDFQPPSAPAVLSPDRGSPSKAARNPGLEAAAQQKSGPPAGVSRPAAPLARRWKAAAGGLALAAAAIICASAALMSSAPYATNREVAAVAAAEPVMPQSPETLSPPSDAGPPTEKGAPAEPLQLGDLMTRFDSLPPAAADAPPAAVEAPRPASFGLEDAAPAFTPAPANPPAARTIADPNDAPAATARAATDTPLPPQAPKPAAVAAATPDAPTGPPTAKRDAMHKTATKPAPQKPEKSAKAAAKPAQGDRQAPQAAPLNAAESLPAPTQAAASPAPPAPTPRPPTIQQRVADGVTHAFGYLMGLPGALVPHPAEPAAGADPSGPR